MSIAAYQNNQDLDILSASPLELVRLLYAGAIDATRAAREHLEQGEPALRSRQISKACAIVQELALSLDRAAGGEVAANLAELYVYLHGRLLEANVTQTAAPLVEVEKHLETLLDAWRQIEEPAAGVSSGLSALSIATTEDDDDLAYYSGHRLHPLTA